jgi:hypothetical protein
MSKKASNPCAITGGVHAPMLRVTRGPVTPAMAAQHDCVGKCLWQRVVVRSGAKLQRRGTLVAILFVKVQH